MTTGNATPSTSLRAEALKAEGSGQAIESRRFGVEIEVEGIPSASLRAGSTERAWRERRRARRVT